MLRQLAALAILASLSSTALAADVIRFDLGSADDASGEDWNDVTSPARLGVIVTNAVTTSGRTTGVTYGHVRAFAGVDTTGHSGYSQYPSRATRDGFTLGTPGKRDAVIEIGGLSPAKSYDFRFYGSTAESTAQRRTEIEIGQRSATLTVSGNESTFVGLEKVRPNLNGVVSISVKCPERSAGATLGVVEVRGDFPSRETARRPADRLDGVPLVSAKAWAIVDGVSGDYLWGANADEARRGADTAQLMAAWLVVRLAIDERRCLDEEVTISELAASSPGKRVGLAAGDKVAVRDLVYAAVLGSASDAANALAEHFDGRFLLVDKKDESKDKALATRANFLAEMNRTATEVGMTRTLYRSPVGDVDGDAETTSARDQANLAWTVMGDERFKKIANSRSHRFTVTGKDGAARELSVTAANHLLEIEGYDGVKAAGDEQSGACLVASGRRGDDRLLVVVLGATSSEGRYVDARNLFRWAWIERGHKPGEGD